MDDMKFKLLMFALPFAGVGLICMLIGIGFARRDRRRAERCVASITGVVSRVVRVHDEGNEYDYHPLVSYTVDGATYEVAPDGSSRTPKWRVGDPMTVAYDPTDPKYAYLPSENSSTPTAGVGVAAGILALLIGATAITCALLM
ncbi:DUF3592 domain-containing protein [Bifidobacterium sp. CP2]|uniref:DUF3592 domain-containing protein n=1 Tax=Bifidobacterium sp. CP2 TaxID=2809025 RepID=UPI001BDDB737|nr:DUF3592 domain-containing protein [Bifidobacterium sp. CP2]MBT1181264.1 DUF3592 domain-containing protein [Bifidobacterium sp. CP2]